MRWTAELDRLNAALVFGRPVRGAYRSHRGDSALCGRVVKTLRDPQVWRDFAWLITHRSSASRSASSRSRSCRASLGVATLPLWYWSIPDGVDFGLWNVDTFLEAVAGRVAGHPAGLRHRVAHARDGQVARVAGRGAARPLLGQSCGRGPARSVGRTTRRRAPGGGIASWPGAAGGLLADELGELADHPRDVVCRRLRSVTSAS